jgi:hypothetical protein
MRFNSNYVASDDNDYWVSGVKKEGDNRYPWGNQKIKLQKSAIEEFLALRNETAVDKSQFEIVDMSDNFVVEDDEDI